MVDRQMLPEGLAQLPPGPALAVALASVDRTRVASADLHVLARARARQVAFEQAALLADMLECAYSPYDAAEDSLERVRELGEFSADQVAFTLVWSRSGAEDQVLLAQDLTERLPVVYAALAAGRIDLYRARAFSEALSRLDDDKARAVAARLIDKAARWTATTLRERLRYHVLRADPDAAKKRYQHGVAGRRVYTRLDDDGTAAVGGTNLPPDRAAAAYNRVDRLARAAKADGDTRCLSQLRADAYLDLLAGLPFTVRPSTDPITKAADAVGAEGGIGTDDPPYPSATPGQPIGVALLGDADPGPDAGQGWDDSEPDDLDPIGVATLGEVGDIDWTGIPHTARSLYGITADPADDPTGGPESPSATGKIDPDPAPSANQVPDDPRLCACGGVRPAPRRGVVDLQIKLSTLMCLDEDPGLIPGWGPVIADIARQVAFDQEYNPAWLWSVTDERGNLLHHGHTRRRPTAEEKAYVKARDRTCRAPGCRQPAIRCDDDHRQEYANDGPSHRANLCVLCRHHHRLRHEKGFVVHQIHAATHMWQAPNGCLYLVTGDGDLILTVEDSDGAPPPGLVNSLIPDDDLEDAHDYDYADLSAATP